MIIKVNRNALVDGLKKIAKGIGTGNVQDVFKGIKLGVKDNENLVLSANNGVFAIESLVAAEVAEKGELILTSDFVELARKLPVGELITIKTKENNKVEISCGKAKLVTSYLDSKLFPEFPVIEDAKVISFNGDTFREIVQKVSVSLGDDNVRPVLGGVLFKAESGNVEIVTSDGFRLTLIKKIIDVDNFELVIAGVGLFEAARVLNGEDIEMAFSDKYCIISSSGTRVFARLLDSKQFPVKYADLIQTSFATTISANTDELVQALERVKASVKAESLSLVKFIIKDGSLLLEGNSKSTCSLFEEMLDVTQTGNDLEIGFNVNFLLDGLKTISDKEVAIGFNNALSPAFINKEGYTYLILPVRMVG